MSEDKNSAYPVGRYWFLFCFTSVTLIILLISNDLSLPSASASHSRGHALDSVVTYTGSTLAISTSNTDSPPTTSRVVGVSSLITTCFHNLILRSVNLHLYPVPLHRPPFPALCRSETRPRCYSHSICRYLSPFSSLPILLARPPKPPSR